MPTAADSSTAGATATAGSAAAAADAKAATAATAAAAAAAAAGDGSARKQQLPQPTRAHFRKVQLLGRGNVGKVFLVHAHGLPQHKGLFAMKVVSKSEVRARAKVARVWAERELLRRFCHPFVVRLRATFQTPLKIYFVLQYCAGGELSRLLRRQVRSSTRDLLVLSPSSSD